MPNKHLKRFLKVGLPVLGALGAAAAALGVGHHLGHQAGMAAGHQAGMAAGHQAGMLEGHQAGVELANRLHNEYNAMRGRDDVTVM
jgi:hypothetical protein